jgi:predicted flap endonuclease-1-like 5' DNA nuclease
MNLAQDMWLRGQAAQRSLMELTAYNVAFLSNAAIQTVGLGLSAPSNFWSAMDRATARKPKSSRARMAAPEAVAPTPAPPPSEPAPEQVSAEVVQLHPDPAVKPDAPATGPSPHLLDAPRGGVADDLTALKGVGAKLAEALNEFGIYHFDQIATLDPEGIAWLNDQQPGFRMICARYDLVAQAQARTQARQA